MTSSLIGHNARKACVDALPASMQHIADTLGLAVVFGLVEHFGGLELRIPHKCHEKHQLLVLGEESAALLCEHYANETIDVPISLDKRRLKRQVDHLASLGMKRAEIARELGITQRHARRLANQEPAAPLEEVPPEDRGPDLFTWADED